MPQPFFSTIIPVYNRRELVVPAIESALQQTFADQEIIVVDDGSTDGTADVIRERFGGKVRLLSQPNAGPGPARNTGIKAATGTYVAFLDSDDRWFPWALETYRQAIEQHRMPAFVTGKERTFRSEAELAGVSNRPLRVEVFNDYLASSDQWRWWGVSSFVIKRDVLLAAGGFAEAVKISEDADLSMRLGTASGFVHVSEPVTFAYRDHAASVRHNLDKNLADLQYQLATEVAGKYPGGTARAMDRHRILCRFVRPLSLELLRAGQRDAAWSLYRQTLRWHLRLRRLRYLAAFPLIATWAKVRGG
jgi:glycosyltransferase involved in cell wall biosynthesis